MVGALQSRPRCVAILSLVSAPAPQAGSRAACDALGRLALCVRARSLAIAKFICAIIASAPRGLGRDQLFALLKDHRVPQSFGPWSRNSGSFLKDGSLRPSATTLNGEKKDEACTLIAKYCGGRDGC